MVEVTLIGYDPHIRRRRSNSKVSLSLWSSVPCFRALMQKCLGFCSSNFTFFILFSCCGHVRRDGFIFFVVLCQLISCYLQIYRCNWIWALGLSGLLLFDLDVSQDLSNLVDAMEIMCCLEHQLCGYVFSGKIFEKCWRIQKALSQQAHGYKQEGGDSMVWSSTWRRVTTCGCAAWFSRPPDAKV